ncbi:hypothetical protein SNEBB_008834 [Seison nebaliae]|nr:hypothetical protein SNEBB_008834 [Seison nebaliae]
MLKLFCSLVIVAIVVPQAYALTSCYTGIGLLKVKTPCNKEFCMKAVLSNIPTRSCADVCDESVSGVYCCDTDNCNSAGNVQINMMSLILSVIGGILVLKFYV